MPVATRDPERATRLAPAAIDYYKVDRKNGFLVLRYRDENFNFKEAMELYGSRLLDGDTTAAVITRRKGYLTFKNMLRLGDWAHVNDPISSLKSKSGVIFQDPDTGLLPFLGFADPNKRSKIIILKATMKEAAQLVRLRGSTVDIATTGVLAVPTAAIGISILATGLSPAYYAVLAAAELLASAALLKMHKSSKRDLRGRKVVESAEADKVREELLRLFGERKEQTV